MQIVESLAASAIPGSAEVDLEVFFPVLLWKIAEDLVGGGNLGAVIEVGVDVAGRSDVAVAQPFLDVLSSFDDENENHKSSIIY